MKFLEDFKIKHLAAFVGNEVGKSVYIISIEIDPEVYMSTNAEGEYINGSDLQYCTVKYEERKPDAEPETARFVWYCEDEELQLIEKVGR